MHHTKVIGERRGYTLFSSFTTVSNKLCSCYSSNLTTSDPMYHRPCYPLSYTSSSGDIIQYYLQRVNKLRLVFTARTEGNQDIIVKLGYRRYGVEAHQAAAESGLAPAFINFSELAGGWWIVVMEMLDESFPPCDDFKYLEQPCKKVIRESVEKFDNLGFVHGNMRDTNMFIRKSEGEDGWVCQIIDHD
ncbi:hypothetical protein F5878DRAFT_534224 [Lentinula raphanica]|uniref:Protein kinase domain-containing protein n=1 Tax=Lentinula raphanica TaxID=153919 RepID=A0AA38PCF0_9AGAR|nr:hypothetical protein F5878DRAFT_534224 [Lentinula raphanica]